MYKNIIFIQLKSLNKIYESTCKFVIQMFHKVTWLPTVTDHYAIQSNFCLRQSLLSNKFFKIAKISKSNHKIWNPLKVTTSLKWRQPFLELKVWNVLLLLAYCKQPLDRFSTREGNLPDCFKELTFTWLKPLKHLYSYANETWKVWSTMV